MLDAKTLDQKLKADNPQYERILKSDLHDLVALLKKGGYTPRAVMVEMKKIKGPKWQKYRQTRAYILSAVPGLQSLVKPGIANFKTRILTALSGGNIKHDASWESDTGSLTDLTQVYVREKVSWAAADNAAKPYLDPAYQVAGQHFGVGNAATSPGTVGNMSDTHDAKGAWAPAVFDFKGPGSISYTCVQVYQCSEDNKATWTDIPDSNYEIVRTVEKQGSKVKMSIHKRSVRPSSRSEQCSNSLLA